MSKGAYSALRADTAVMGRDLTENNRVYAEYLSKEQTWQPRRAVATAETLPIFYLSVAISRGWPTISLPKYLIGTKFEITMVYKVLPPVSNNGSVVGADLEIRRSPSID